MLRKTTQPSAQCSTPAWLQSVFQRVEDERLADIARQRAAEIRKQEHV